MRGAAHLAIAAPDKELLSDMPEVGYCSLCGTPTNYTGTRRNGPGGVLTDTFTDRDRILLPVGAAGRYICPQCATAVDRWSSETGPTSAPRGNPWLLADGQVTRMNGGLQGLVDIALLSNRAGPFALIVGTWSNKAFHWVWAPVAYPSRVFPALYVSRGNKTTKNTLLRYLYRATGGPVTVWIDSEQVAALVEHAKALGAAPDDDGKLVPPTGIEPFELFLQLWQSLERISSENGRELLAHVLLAEPSTRQRRASRTTTTTH